MQGLQNDRLNDNNKYVVCSLVFLVVVSTIGIVDFSVNLEIPLVRQMGLKTARSRYGLTDAYYADADDDQSR
jgi:hypothetical protein